MTKVRVYELAKEYKIPTKEFVELLKSFNLDIKSHMSVLEGENLEIIREYFAEEESKSTETAVIEEQIQKQEEKNIKKSKPKAKEGLATSGKQSTKDKKEPTVATDDMTQKKGKRRSNETGKTDIRKPERAANEIEIPETIIVKDLAEKLGVSVNQIISKLIELGIMANQNQTVDYDYAELIGQEFGKVVIPEVAEEPESLDNVLDYEDAPEDLKPRPPVVAVMGHVDHGKTSLLDAIRKTSVTTTEAGGITQHIGASTAYVNNQKIVFLDTPGHEAFTSMRMRGAQSTDIAILVVAADDGVMPQTIEAINHAKAANIPIIVAINKIDKEAANPDRVKQELADHGLIPEEWGGNTIMVGVSALKGLGIDDLLEMVLMLAEIEELKANPKRHAVGMIIEAQLDKGRGPVATVLVQKGTLKASDYVISGSASGRIRAMFDDKGKSVKKALPSTPVLILGLSEVPEAGDMIYAVEDEKTARSFAGKIKMQRRDDQLKSSEGVKLDDLFRKISEGTIKDLNIIVKTDVKGTIDAVKNSLEKLSNEEVKVNIIHGAVGGITESDIMLATASQAIIIGFNVRPNQGALEQAQLDDVDVRTYRVIYDAIDDVKAAIKGMLAPKYKEAILGRAEVRDTFKVPHAGTVAGVYVVSGKLTRNCEIRLLRDDIVIFEGKISSLRRFKDDVKELNHGYEGGVGIENYNDVKNGDILEGFEMVEVKQ